MAVYGDGALRWQDLTDEEQAAHWARRLPPCARCGRRLTADEQHYYGDHCNTCAAEESAAYDEARRQP